MDSFAAFVGNRFCFPFSVGCFSSYADKRALVLPANALADHLKGQAGVGGDFGLGGNGAVVLIVGSDVFHDLAERRISSVNLFPFALSEKHFS